MVNGAMTLESSSLIAWTDLAPLAYFFQYSRHIVFERLATNREVHSDVIKRGRSSTVDVPDPLWPNVAPIGQFHDPEVAFYLFNDLIKRHLIIQPRIQLLGALRKLSPIRQTEIATKYRRISHSEFGFRLEHFQVDPS